MHIKVQEILHIEKHRKFFKLYVKLACLSIQDVCLDVETTQTLESHIFQQILRTWNLQVRASKQETSKLVL